MSPPDLKDWPTPNVLITASWLATALASTAASPRTSPVWTRTRGGAGDNFAGSRTSTATSKPASNACCTTWRPVPPVAPRTRTRCDVTLASVSGPPTRALQLRAPHAPGGPKAGLVNDHEQAHKRNVFLAW